MSEFHTQTVFIPGYNEVKVSTGKLARNADGAVLVEAGNISLLATVVYSKKSTSLDFLPLLVEYREKFSAIGKIPMGFAKREGKLTDREILISRLVDRTLRPMFDKNFHNDVHVCINLLSANFNSIPDYLVCFAASLAVYSSNLPFLAPVANVCVARTNGEFVFNPEYLSSKNSSFFLTVGGNKNGVLMLEGNMEEVKNGEIVDAVGRAQMEIIKLCEFQENFVKNLNVKRLVVEKKDAVDVPVNVNDKVKEIFLKGIENKIVRDTEIMEVLNGCFKDEDDAERFLEKLKRKLVHDLAFENGKRVDGRKFYEVRHIECEIDNLPCSHGSALFTRGRTQALASVTLGSKLDEFHSDSVLCNKSENFVVHYNFHGFATAEMKSLEKKISRRELGHGSLACRALKSVLPGDGENPFTIRVVSDILESDGSSSMATVCAGSLALMDAGIQIKSPVAGIAMGGLLKDDSYVILSDISADEDASGDLDMKVAGTKNGITALQLDVKVDFLSLNLLGKILDQAEKGRFEILDKMNACMAVPREKTKEFAPSCKVLHISKNMMGSVIGPNGKMIQNLQRSTGAIINVFEKDNRGIVKIFGYNEKIVQAAENEISAIVNQPVLNEIYDGVVQSVLNYGAFVEFLPGKVGLLRTCDVDIVKIDDLPSVLKVGDMISVMLIEILPDNKYGLSHKALIEKDIS